ncbi:MAG: DUF3775 domain-containing protein [Solirubrobacterales bacterium]
MLRIPLDKVCIIVEMAREALGSEPPEGSVMLVDGEEAGVLPSTEDYDGAQASDSLFDYVDALNGDELSDLLALVWVGRGDFIPSEWQDAQEEADVELSDGDALAEIIRDPTLPDDLIAGLEALGYDCPEG